jgi:hypothetical protein
MKLVKLRSRRECVGVRLNPRDHTLVLVPTKLLHTKDCIVIQPVAGIGPFVYFVVTVGL